MYLMNSDIEALSEHVILGCKRRRMHLTEGERKRIIGVAIGTLQRSNGTDNDLRVVREQVEWEMNLIGSTRSAFSVVDLSRYTKLPNRAALEMYLGSIGAALHKDEEGFWVELPKGFSVGETKKEILRHCGRA